MAHAASSGKCRELRESHPGRAVVYERHGKPGPAKSPTKSHTHRIGSQWEHQQRPAKPSRRGQVPQSVRVQVLHRIACRRVFRSILQRTGGRWPSTVEEIVCLYERYGLSLNILDAPGLSAMLLNEGFVVVGRHADEQIIVRRALHELAEHIQRVSDGEPPLMVPWELLTQQFPDTARHMHRVASMVERGPNHFLMTTPV